MKTWSTYTVAFILGLATCLLFNPMAGVLDIFKEITSYLLSLSVFIFSPLVLFSFTSGIASLGKDKLGGRFSDRFVTWTLLTSILLPLFAGICFLIFPVTFPVTSSAGSEGNIASSTLSYAVSEAMAAIIPENPTYTMLFSSTFPLPLILICWAFGLALRPKSDIVRPAYAVMNSFSEVMMKLSKMAMLFGFLTVYFSSSVFFMTLYQDGSVLVSVAFSLMITITALILLFLIIPLIFLLVTFGKSNPWKNIRLSYSALVHALFSGNVLASAHVMIMTERCNLGVQKRIATTSTPFFLIFSHGGSAAIATITTLSLIYAFSGVINFPVVMAIALIAIPVSFTSSIAVSFETVTIGYLATQLLNINLYGAESAIFAILPFVNGLGSMLDTALCTLGAKAIAIKCRTSLEVPKKDRI